MKVSVILPTYNSVDFLARAMQSIQSQSLSDIEILAVDDGSTDGTPGALARYACHDARIRVFLLSENKGVGNARNHALTHARGEWIAILDSDDWWEKDRLMRLTQYADRRQWDIVLDDFWMSPDYDDDSHDPARRWSTIDGAVSELLGHRITACDIAKTSVAFLKPVIRRDWIVSVDHQWQPWRYSEDFGFLFEAALLGARIGVLTEAFYHYRSQRPGSLTSQSLDLFQGVRNSAAFYERMVALSETDLHTGTQCSRERLMMLLRTRRRKAQRTYVLRYLLTRLLPNRHLQEQLLAVYHRFHEF